jgi:protein TonB
MSYFMNNQQKINDIIFADRNKEYGAYAIRSSYGNTIFRSLAYVISGVTNLALIAFYFTHKNNLNPMQNTGQLIVHDSVYVIPFNADPEEKKKEVEKNKEVAKQAEAKKEENNSTVINDSVKEVVTTALNFSLSSGTSTLIATVDVPIGTDTKKGATSGGGSPNGDIKGTFEVDSEPQFEGGLAALYRFVASHLRYPALASEEGKEGTVFVKFVVDENGKVGNLSLLNSVGYGMDDEALRVIALIPKFKSPAKIRGEAVKVYYQLPIKFRFR